ncbi:hypothetical protein FRC03_008503 [Tulasnella sp. 419]|nr:hypothetical protein FRC03_008503 [Tulasnella sp. 419]
MDLQAALDHGRPMSPDGRRTPSPFRATFVPPPVYNEKGSGSGATSPISPGRSSPNSAVSPTSPTGLYIANPDHDINRITGMLGPLPTDRSTDRSTNRSTNRSTYRSSSPVPQRSVPPLPPRGHSRVQSAGGFLQPPITTSTSTSSSPSSSTMPLHRPSSPTILTAADPAINVIRETLYASLADVISRTPSIRPVIKSDPPRAYFASLGLAILDFSMYSLTPEGNVKAVLGAELKLEDCPPGYRPFMLELSGISQKVKEMATEDDDKAMEILTEDSEAVLPEPRIDHVKRMLERGIGRENDELTDSAPEVGGGRSTTARRRSTRSRSRSTDGSAVRLSNRINTLALNMMKLEAFRERQHDVFKVLAGAR